MQQIPAHLSAKTGLVVVRRDQGELGQAQQLYQQVLALAPRDANALAGLAGALHDSGDEQGALNHLPDSSWLTEAARCFLERSGPRDVQRDERPGSPSASRLGNAAPEEELRA